MLACFFVFGLTGRSGGRSLTSGVAGSQAPVSHQTLPSPPSALSGYMVVIPCILGPRVALSLLT